MPLSPEAELLNCQRVSAPTPLSHGMSASEFRRMVDEAVVIGAPDPGLDITDHEVDLGEVRLPFRRYGLKGAAIPSAGILFLHGGGFVLCSIDTHDDFCRRMARATGAMVISLGYRLAPEHRFPAAIEDAEAMLRHLLEHGAIYSVDPGRLAIAGDSAGAALAVAAVRAQTGEDGANVAHQLLINPVLDLEFERQSHEDYAEGFALSRPMMEWYRDNYLVTLEERFDPRASPLRGPIDRRLPPATILTAECDPVRDDGEAYADALERAGVDVSLTRVEGVFHGFAFVSDQIPQAAEAIEAAFSRVRGSLAAA